MASFWLEAGPPVELVWLKTASCRRTRPWARLQVKLPDGRKIGSANAKFYLLVNLRGTRMLVEKRYDNSSGYLAGKNEADIALDLSALRQTAILRSVPATECLSETGSSCTRGIQLFSEFAPGGSLSEWIESAARCCGLRERGGRSARFGAIRLDDDSVSASMRSTHASEWWLPSCSPVSPRRQRRQKQC